MTTEIKKLVIEDIKFRTFKSEVKKNNDEGLVCLGCGGDPQEWIDGITKAMNDEGCAKGTPEELWKKVYRLTSTGGRTDIVFVSHNCLEGFNVGRMSMWKLRMGMTWISDYIVNYAKHF